jgi:phosphoribosylformylglycinamidine synthase
MIEPRVWRELGLKDEEYDRILRTLGREPTPTELAMFSVEWSEHCGYPRSRSLLALLPRDGKYPTRARGEDAGGIEFSPGLMVLFKMESHNHPSQVEPKQGAATGIGGIIRDIFTMGARPIALLDSLRFGDLRSPLAKYLLRGVVDGIQFYGNCLGVPTVGGEVSFDDSYRGNCLVNVMAIGLVESDKIALPIATGPGNPVMIVGNSTGRDGIGGASILASHEFGENEEKRPTVQIGDPFTEKCLIEACLEALQTGAIIGLKDMGAAGITCTTCEMSASGRHGMDIDLALVPRREAGMEPWELMMSESQERMLVVLQKGREQQVRRIFEKWGLNAVIIGQVTADGILTVRDDGRPVAQLEAALLADPPTYDIPAQEPAYYRQAQQADLSRLPQPEDCSRLLLSLLASPNIASKHWVYRQYDHMVQTNTVLPPGPADAAVLLVKGRPEGLAACTDGNGRYCYLDPFLGAQIAVAEAARNVVCVGADPAAITDCLNFGNPEKPDRFWQFKRAVEGIAHACRHLELAVVSGNVSFYNETPESAVFPTPVIGLVGVLKDVRKHCTPGFKQPGDAILLLGETKDELGASEYLSLEHGLTTGCPPSLDLDREKRVQATCLEAIQTGLLKSAHDCSDGGLAVALAECCLWGQIGARLVVPETEQALRPDSWLFAETQSRIIVSADPATLPGLASLAEKHGAPLQHLGEVGGESLRIARRSKWLLEAPLPLLADAYSNSLERLLEE